MSHLIHFQIELIPPTPPTPPSKINFRVSFVSRAPSFLHHVLLWMLFCNPWYFFFHIFFWFPFSLCDVSHTRGTTPIPIQKNMIKNSWLCNVTDCLLRPRSKMYVFTQTDEVLRQSSVYLIFVLKQKLFSWQSKDNVEHKLFCIIAEMCLRATF